MILSKEKADITKHKSETTNKKTTSRDLPFSDQVVRTIRQPVNRKTKKEKKFPDQTNMLLKTKNPDQAKKKQNPETYQPYVEQLQPADPTDNRIQCLQKLPMSDL